MKRARHNLSHYKLCTMNMGQLVPVGSYPVVRGDSIRQRTKVMLRMAPMLAPLMHPVHVKIHHWFVPNRIIWDNWEKFITGGPDGQNATIHPYIVINNAAVGSLADYLKVPPSVASARNINALPFRACALIWNKFYRDQDLQTELAISKGDGADATTSTALQNAAWMKDYFTTARPEPQKGDETVIPISGTGTVTTTTPGATLVTNSQTPTFNTTGTAPNLANAPLNTTVGTPAGATFSGNAGGVKAPTFGNQSGLKLPDSTEIGDFDPTDLSIDVIDLRLSNALQRFKEARSRFGSEYVDYLNYYGIKSSDARLQRPEYLGGGRETVKFSEVLQTAPDSTDGDSLADGVGNLYGHGINTTASSPFKKFFEEDGWIISFMVVNPITMYTQGIPKELSLTTKEDYFQKELAHIGQEQILNKEVYSAHATPDGTFGWQNRYDWLRRIENSIAGEFRTLLNYWHLGRIFSSDPALNADFIKSNPSNRVFASTSTNQIYAYVRHDIQARRIVPTEGNAFLK